MKRVGIIGAFVILFVAFAAFPAADPVRAASPSDFAGASGSIGTAYLAVSRAQQDGGNVSGLVTNLNVALELYTKAQSENSSNPARALADLQNATTIAQQVALEAPGIGQTGAAARQAQEYISVGSAVAIVAVAALLYVYGERIYHRLWLRMYSGYLVKKVG